MARAEYTLVDVEMKGAASINKHYNQLNRCSLLHHKICLFSFLVRMFYSSFSLSFNATVMFY